jgi:hypothetical protein
MSCLRTQLQCNKNAFVLVNLKCKSVLCCFLLITVLNTDGNVTVFYPENSIKKHVAFLIHLRGFSNIYALYCVELEIEENGVERM